MSPLAYILIALAAIGGLIAVFLLFGRSSGHQPRDRQAVIREAKRRLAQNPKDAQALLSLADLAFESEDFPTAFEHYSALLPLCAVNPALDEFTVNLRYAQSARNMGNNEEAHRGFVLAQTIKKEDFEVNYNLGVLEYQRQNYPKAVACLRLAAEAQPEHGPTQKYLGHSLFQMKLYSDAAGALEKALDQELDDKGSQFTLARARFALTQNEPALAVFSRLRTDPAFGPQAALYAGTIHMNTKQYAAAIEDFRIGLRHSVAAPEVVLELKYRLGGVLAREGEVAQALALWKEIVSVHADYKDVRSLISEYQEVHSSRYLSEFLIASSVEFLTLCRKLAAGYFSGATFTALAIQLNRSDYADILAKVHDSQREELVLFRFLRTGGTVGELMLRDFNARLKDVNAGRGVCLCAGIFSEQARAFVEARRIELVGKDGLTRLFKKL
jgi:tetratricopeptide (TPR) repeat protein